MPRFGTGVVASIISERAGLQRVEVRHRDGAVRRAYVLTGLIGTVATGDRVVVNTTAVDLGLGSGGWDVVHWNLSREAYDAPGPGHIMKLRYTSLQADTGAAEEAAGRDGGSGLGGVPVVACALHSQVPCVAAAFKAAAPGTRLVYVMTDTAALPLALSDTVARLRDEGLLDATVTAGHAFGGDHEAVNVPSALELARHLAGAGAIVAGAGPGVVGTASRLGFTPLDVATTVDATARLGGRPVVALRVSDADARPRHRGVSHHSRTALGFAHGRALVPVPAGEPHPPVGDHDVVEVEVPDVAAILAARGLRVTTMGRGVADDPRFFAYAAAAGAAAAGLAAVASRRVAPRAADQPDGDPSGHGAPPHP